MGVAALAQPLALALCAEVAQIADALDFSGVWLLNASYQWGCTARAVEQDGAPWIIRTLDWPFKGLGRHIAVAHMRGAGGDFFSVTWPGYVGALTAMAPGRFAACINQAPMWRRTRHRWLRPFDFAVNALKIWRASMTFRRISCCAGFSRSATIIPRRGTCLKRRRWRGR